jgi:hypothetical protein
MDVFNALGAFLLPTFLSVVSELEGLPDLH